jgi:hypothetical protein
MPLFFVPKPVVAFIGFTSMARDDGLFLNAGNFNRDTPGKFVDFFSQL